MYFLNYHITLWFGNITTSLCLLTTTLVIAVQLSGTVCPVISGRQNRLVNITPGRTSKVTPPSWFQERGADEPFLGFPYITIFRKDFTFSRKPVNCSTRRGTYYRLLRFWGPVTSSKMATILGAIFGFTKNSKLLKKTLKIRHLCAGHVEYNI